MQAASRPSTRGGPPSPPTPDTGNLALPQPSLYNSSSGRSSPIFLNDPSGGGGSIGPGAKDFAPQAEALKVEKDVVLSTKQEMQNSVAESLKNHVRSLDDDAWQYEPVEL